MGHDPKPSRQSTEAERNLPVVLEGGSHLGHALGQVASQATVEGAVARALFPFLTRDDGWLRLSPADDGETVYFKWKWTGGPYANHYVMTVYPAREAQQALLSLAAKVDAVDSGVKRPVKDHYFHQ